MVSISSFQNHHTTAPLCSLLDRGEREGEGDYDWRRKREKRERGVKKKKERGMETKQMGGNGGKKEVETSETAV